MKQDPVFATIEYLEKKKNLENIHEKSKLKKESRQEKTVSNNTNALLKEFMTLLSEEMKKPPAEKNNNATKKEKRFSVEKALKKTSNVDIKYSADFLNLLDEELSKKIKEDETVKEVLLIDQKKKDDVNDDSAMHSNIIIKEEDTIAVEDEKLNNIIDEEVKDISNENIEKHDIEVREADPISLYENFLSNSYKREIKERTDFVTFDDLKKHYIDFLNKINIQLGSLGGGGEVLLKRLDDLDFNTMQDGYFIKYDASTGKFVGHFIAQTSEIVDGGSF